LKEAPLLKVIAGPGVYFCSVAAFNEFGDSGLSNEVTFRAGTIPNAPNTLIITAN